MITLPLWLTGEALSHQRGRRIRGLYPQHARGELRMRNPTGVQRITPQRQLIKLTTVYPKSGCLRNQGQNRLSQPRQTRDKPTQQSRSKVVRTGRLRFRWNAATCSRRAAFSTATAWWAVTRSRTNRKMDKKMTGMVPIVRLHPTPSQPFKAGPNNGEAQDRFT